jgi:hypothetical protein
VNCNEALFAGGLGRIFELPRPRPCSDAAIPGLGYAGYVGYAELESEGGPLTVGFNDKAIHVYTQRPTEMVQPIRKYGVTAVTVVTAAFHSVGRIRRDPIRQLGVTNVTAVTREAWPRGRRRAGVRGVVATGSNRSP